MAIHEFDCKGYGQIEPSQVWFTRAGMSESQCELDPKRFASHFPMLPQEIADGKIVAENGAFLVIDKERKLATVPNKNMCDRGGFKVGINYSTERIYNQYTPGRRNFCMIAGEYLPRIGFIEPGMRICTNAVCWDDSCSLFSTGVDNDSKKMYDKVKAYLAKIRSVEGREHLNEKIDLSESGKGYAPLYAVLLDDSAYNTTVASTSSGGVGVNNNCQNKGKLVIGGNLAKAIGNIYAIVTEAYHNADGTLSFKLMFVDKPALTSTQNGPTVDD